MNPEHEPRLDYDPFSEALSTYVRDVDAMEADGLEDIGNNRLRLTYAFSDLLESLAVPHEQVIEKSSTLLPDASPAELGFSELITLFKLAPLRLIDPTLPDCPLPIEQLTPTRISTIFNSALIGEAPDHLGCINASRAGDIFCAQNLTCPMLLSRRIGSDVFGLLVISDQLHETNEREHYSTTANLAQLSETLTSHLVMSPAELELYRRHAEEYTDSEFLRVGPGNYRASDDVNGN